MTEQNNILSIINGEHWRFAKTYANSNPHEYIVRSKCSSVEIFDCLCEYIKNNGQFLECELYQKFSNWKIYLLGYGRCY